MTNLALRSYFCFYMRIQETSNPDQNFDSLSVHDKLFQFKFRTYPQSYDALKPVAFNVYKRQKKNFFPPISFIIKRMDLKNINYEYLENALLNTSGKVPLAERFRALFTLKNIGDNKSLDICAKGKAKHKLHY